MARTTEASGLTQFQQAVVTRIKEVPFGKVVSYGQIAASIGMPQAARQVGWALSHLDGADEVPWWRVINAAGKITIQGSLIDSAYVQRRLLESEGVVVSDALTIEIEKYRYNFA